jgi:MFS family permease
MMTSSPTSQDVRTGPVLAIILASYTMIVLDISIVITALLTIRTTLDFSSTALSWVQNAYLLAFGGLLLLGARAGDLLGRRRMFIVGLGLFTVASVAVGSAQTELWLIAARAAQGAGAAILAPTTLALLQTSFPEGSERTGAVSYYAAVAGVAATVGLVVGGIFAGWLTWRVGFFINAPIGIALMLAAPRYLPKTQPRRGRMDAAGAISSTLGMTALIFGIVRGRLRMDGRCRAGVPGGGRRAAGAVRLQRAAGAAASDAAAAVREPRARGRLRGTPNHRSTR